MANYFIGLSGLDAAQKAFEIIGNNIANAATEGYHRQRIDLTPAYSSQKGPVILGGGVDVVGVTRIIDDFLQKEMFRQQSSLEQASQELATLRTVENAFGELSGAGGLSTAIDEFFNALQDLCAHPAEGIWQNQAVTAAETMAAQFRALGEFFSALENQIILEAENTIGQVNVLASRIAELNHSIERQEVGGGRANNLRDHRDQCITELSRLISVDTVAREYGVVDLSVVGMPVVTSTSTCELELGLKENLGLGITVAGGFNYNINVQGGRLGALLSLRNDLVSDIHSDLDTLARAMIEQINRYHVQGVGSEGSFTELTGSAAVSENLGDTDPPITDGHIYIRVTNTATGAITREDIDLGSMSPTTLSNVAAEITARTGLAASVVSSRLRIQAETGYQFDFLPAMLPEPTAATLTGGAPPTISVSGIYTGAENDTFKFTVSDAGLVGNGILQLEVTDNGGTGDVIAVLNIGDGYAAGDRLDIGNGIGIAISPGDFEVGDNFDVDAFADTDTSGLLAAAGINTFFLGSNASDIAVCSDITATPSRIATGLGADMTDNANALRMEGLKEQAITSLNRLTPGEFYRCLVTDIGQQVSVKQMRRDNIQVIVQELDNQQSEISGVDINEEAARLLIFEQMFKAMAKYLTTIQSSLSTLMEII